MSLLLLGESLQALGEIFVALTVLFVHRRVRKEHTIDASVLRAMRREQSFGIVGILLIIVGFLIKIFARLL